MSLERRTPLRRDGKGARAFAAQRSQLKRSGPLRSTYKVGKRGEPSAPGEGRRGRRGGDWSEGTRRIVAARSGGRCEAKVGDGVCHGRAVQLHHRKLRGHGDHRPVNALHVCAGCHTWIHGHPRASYRRGWLVESHRDPAEVEVLPFAA